MSEWQPIETAPKDGSLFIGVRLISITNGEKEYMVSDARWQDGRYRFRNLLSGTPKHWMQFKEPPDGLVES